MSRRSRSFIWQSVIGFGYLSGIWTAIGIDPTAAILNILGGLIGSLYSDPLVHSALILLPLFLLGISIAGAYRGGKIPGLLSVLIAYAAGLSLLASMTLSLLLLAIAILTGIFATTPRLRRVF